MGAVFESPPRTVAPDGSSPGAPGLNVVIVGLGFCGLTAAIECRLRKMKVTVVEMYPTSREQGDVIDFFGNGGMIIESWDEGRMADEMLKISINNNDTFKIFNQKNELLCEYPWLKYEHHARRQVPTNISPPNRQAHRLTQSIAVCWTSRRDARACQQLCSHAWCRVQAW